MKHRFNSRNSENDCQRNKIGLRNFSTSCVAKLNQIKAKVTESLTAEFGSQLDAQKIRQVVNDADALAAITPFPALFLPTLAEEKILAVAAWQKKQQSLRNDSVTLAFAA